ncbi:MAG: translation initiation factor IF-3 [Lachnospiraceae bacterium]|nr:translation initiation factor IF-3 [Lachnospiraceae bacterium]
MNGDIRDPQIRVIGTAGQQLGVMTPAEAMQLAEEAGVDLVKVAPLAKPPVCKLIDYGKFRYEMTRKEKEARKNRKVVEVKEIRLSVNIDTNDLNTKAGNARKFLEKGNRVKVTLRFRGREMAHVNDNMHILTDFADKLSDISEVVKPPKMEGRSMSLFLAAKSKDSGKKKKQEPLE